MVVNDVVGVVDGDVDPEVVRVDVGVVLVVGDVVGVETEHSWKPPLAKARVMAVSVEAAAAQLFSSIRNWPNAHATSSLAPAGPRNSLTTALMSSFAVLHAVSPLRVSTPSLLQPTTQRLCGTPPGPGSAQQRAAGTRPHSRPLAWASLKSR